MSAITVIYHLNREPLPASAVGKMLDSMKHRGEDAVAVMVDNQVGFGHRMRWTTEESKLETLPFKSPQSSLMITADARIDNRSELIPRLSFNGKKSKDITDSEIILRAYEKWGEDCLPQLIGDFVFAIWNPATRTLFCARDLLGVKHFYYYYEPGQVFALASEIKALFTLPFIRRELDEAHLGDYLVGNFEDKESTAFKNIKRLPATRAITISMDQMRTWCYWHPDPKNEIKLRNHHEYHEAFREKFTEAVTCRLRSAYPVGSTLSGGLDSSSIVCVASEYLARQNKSPLHSFSAIFPTVSQTDTRIDERSYMQSVIKKSGCRAHMVNCDDDNPWKDMKELMKVADHPVGFPNLYLHWKIFKKAKQEGVKILLDGFDGDSTVSYGYQDFAALSKRGRWLRMFKEAVLLSRNMPRPMHSLKNLKHLVIGNGLDKAVPFNLANVWYFINSRKRANQQQKENKTLRWRIINSEFRKKYQLDERLRHHYWLNHSENSNDTEIHWEALTNGLLAKSLEFSELAAQNFPIELRFPFCDRRLIEFCLALPPGERIYNGWTRSIFRYAMNGILPEVVQWRKSKANLGIGLKLNMLKYGSGELEETVNHSPSVLENFINIEMLKKVKQKFTEDPLNSLDYFCLILVAAVHLSSWLRENGFVDRKLFS